MNSFDFKMKESFCLLMLTVREGGGFGLNATKSVSLQVQHQFYHILSKKLDTVHYTVLHSFSVNCIPFKILK